MVQYCSDFGVTEGQTYCDGNNNLYKCVKGAYAYELVFQHAGCAESVSTAPRCDFQISPTSAKVGDTVTFIPLECTATATSWMLDFGDGSSNVYGSGAPVADKRHVYTKAGTYYPKLTTTNSVGSLSAQGTITIAGEALVAPRCDFQIYPTSAKVGDTVTFRPLGCTGDTVTEWFMDFGDGSSYLYGSGAPIADHYHIYSDSGTFYPSLTVGTSWGGSTSATGTISIAASPEVIPPGGWTCDFPCDVFDQACINWQTANCVTPPPTPCSTANCPSPKSCVGGICTAPSTVCSAANCPSPKSCVGGVCTGGGTGGTTTKVECVGLNRSGSLDPTCIMEKGNEPYLYAAIGIIALIVLMKR
jgi:PKD repeat protein